MLPRSIERFVALLLATEILVLATGMPMLAPLASMGVGKDRSQPFPCMDLPCGCATAEQCWQSCCCHTREEQLAWAKQNGVTPPVWVVVDSGKANRSETKAASCCSAKKPCCSTTKKTPVNVASCCQEEEGHVQTTAGPGLVLQSLLTCRGLDQILSAAIVLYRPSDEFASSAEVWFPLPYRDAVDFDPLTLSPPVPPPRLV